MNNISATSFDFELAKRLQLEEENKFLNLENNVHNDSSSSEEILYLSNNSDKDEEYGVNLLGNHASANELEVLNDAKPNTDHDGLLAEQLQAQFNISNSYETSSLDDAIRNQIERESEARHNTSNRTYTTQIGNSFQNDIRQNSSRVRQRFQFLSNPLRRRFPLGISNRQRMPETLDTLFQGLSRVLTSNHMHDFTNDPVGYLETNSIDNILNSAEFNGNDYESLWELAEQIGEAKNKGLDEEAVNNLPTTTYSNERRNVNSRKSTSCVICMEDYKIGEQVKTLPCLHQYHKECIDKWLKNERKCPICQHVLDNN